MTARQVRAARGVAAAWIATVLAAVAHTLAGHGAPGPVMVIAVAVLASPFAVLLAGRRLSLGGLAAAVLTSQALLHVAFVLASTPHPGGSPRATAHHAAALPGVTTQTAAMMPDVPMLTAHVLAAVVTVAILHRGERVLVALGLGIRRILRRALTPAPLAPRPRSLTPVAVRVFAPTRTVASGPRRRGPPFVVAAF